MNRASSGRALKATVFIGLHGMQAANRQSTRLREHLAHAPQRFQPHATVVVRAFPETDPLSAGNLSERAKAAEHVENLITQLPSVCSSELSKLSPFDRNELKLPAGLITKVFYQKIEKDPDFSG